MRAVSGLCSVAVQHFPEMNFNAHSEIQRKHNDLKSIIFLFRHCARCSPGLWVCCVMHRKSGSPEAWRVGPTVTQGPVVGTRGVHPGPASSEPVLPGLGQRAQGSRRDTEASERGPRLPTGLGAHRELGWCSPSPGCTPTGQHTRSHRQEHRASYTLVLEKEEAECPSARLWRVHTHTRTHEHTTHSHTCMYTHTCTHRTHTRGTPLGLPCAPSCRRRRQSQALSASPFSHTWRPEPIAEVGASGEPSSFSRG